MSFHRCLSAAGLEACDAQVRLGHDLAEVSPSVYIDAAKDVVLRSAAVVAVASEAAVAAIALAAQLHWAE